MKLKQHTMQIDGETYTVHELPVKVLLPMADRLSTGGSDAQLELIGKSVSVNGVHLGDAAGDMGASVFMQLVSEVLRVNGMAGDLGNAN